MKSVYILFILNFLFFSPIQAQSDTIPENIYSIIKVQYEIDYYKKQAVLWKTEIKKNQKNTSAWSNFYAAARMVNLLTPYGEEKPFNLNAIIDDAANHIPNTFDYHYIAYWNEGTNPEMFPHLAKAYQLDPDRPETYDAFVSYYEMKRQLSEKEMFCKKLYDANEFSPALLNWNYNMLMSIEENALLFTHGDNDTYPGWILQAAKGIRPDVTILNIHLLQYADYYKRVLKELKLPEAPAFAENLERAERLQNILKHFMDHADRPVYLASTIGKKIREPFSDNLYLTGLAFKYSRAEFDNMAVLKNNVTHKFLMDYLKVNFQNDVSQTVIDHINTNYIPAFVMLYKHFKTGGEMNEANELKELIEKLAESGDIKDKINLILNE